MLLNQVFKGLNDWWRYLLGIALVISGYFLGQIPMTVVLYYKISNDPNYGLEELESFQKNMNFEALGINKNFGFLLLILMFVFAVITLWLVVKHLHIKKMEDLVTPNKPVNINKIVFGFGLWMILSLILELINYWIDPTSYVFRGSGGAFVVLLLISLIFLPIQTSFEELFCRGYIMQGLYFFSKNIWIAVLISSVLFGLIHGMNPEVEKYGFWTMQTYYIAAGLFLAIITVMDDGLELALGVHAATNIFGAVFLTYEGSVLQTDSLFSTTVINPWDMLFGFILSAALFMFICYKKYGWRSVTLLSSDYADATNNITNEL